MITNLGVVKVQNQSNIMTMTEGEIKLQRYYDKLCILAEKTSKNDQDSILLAGAMMAVARLLYFNSLKAPEAEHIIEANTFDFIDLIKPTIH
jgi:hypothetical protein|tara:strand:- start:902 stop:1177 length:276 start_codon:yes stop_codon:yes gene_type:complete